MPLFFALRFSGRKRSSVLHSQLHISNLQHISRSPLLCRQTMLLDLHGLLCSVTDVNNPKQTHGCGCAVRANRYPESDLQV